MVNYSIIPQIGEKITQQFKKLNLVPEIDPIKFIEKKKNIKHRYYSNCLNSKGKKIGFYTRIHDNEDAKSKMIREIIFLQEIKKNKELKINKYIPKFIDGEIKKDFEWFTREYVKGEPLGETHILKYKLSLKDVFFLVEILNGIREIPIYSLGNKIRPYLKEGGTYKHYLSLLRSYRYLLKKGVISKQQYQKISQFVYKNKKLINIQKKIITHSDIHPGNIIVGAKQWIIDWELVRLDNFTYDIAYLWMHLWEADFKFRQKLVMKFFEDTVHPDIFKKLFRLTILDIWINEIFCTLGRTKIKRIKKRQEFLKKLLENTLKDFESTMKI